MPTSRSPLPLKRSSIPSSRAARSTKLRTLCWTPKTGFDALVREMVDADYLAASRDSMVRSAGFKTYDYNE